MAEHETIADIVAEMRALSNPISDGIIAIDGRSIADRLEAAHRRERGDCAKLREAVKLCLRGMCGYCRMDAEARGMTTECVNGCEVMLGAKAALAAPPRNCDVGTAEEQDERFHRFCVMQRKGSCAGCPDPVGGRTVANGIRECALVWAQMPYEGGEK